MKINPGLIAPCGLYCGVCAIYIAHRDHNHKLKERLVNLYKGGIPDKGALPNSENLSIEDIRCRGCLSDDHRNCQEIGNGLNPRAVNIWLRSAMFWAWWRKSRICSS